MHSPVHKLTILSPAERSRSRRERRSESARRPVLHVVMPGLEVARETPRTGETVTAFLRRTGWAWHDRQYGWQFKKSLPTVLEINGEPLLRRHWSRKKIAANDNVRFVSYPLGGRGSAGKQILGLVALVAVAAFAGPLGGALAGGLGLTGTTATIVGGLATAAIGLGGALLVNALTAPKPGGTNSPTATTDQIYSIQAQGNVAKLGQPLPVWYGRLKNYPDLAATPWSEFVGNDQYLNILLSVSMGSMEYEQLLISDTPFWNPTDGVSAAFSSATVEFYEPGDQVTLFPINVSQSDEVSGQQLPHGTGITGAHGTTPGDWLGPFVASPAGETSYQLAVDYAFPSGCFQVDDQGNTTPLSVSLRIERQAVNDAGSPTGDWEIAYEGTKTFSSRSPIRDSILFGVPEGRYQIRFRRNDGVPADNKGASEVIWASLRAYLRGDNTFPDVSTIAIRIKATETTQGSYKFGCIATRKLLVWNADTSAFVLQATRSPMWAALDIASNSQYGAGIASSKTDFNTFVNHAAGCAARGDTFDYVFQAAVSVPEAIDKALTVTRSRHCWLGDTLSVVRDEWTDVPSMLLTDREIVRDSTQVTFTMLGEEDPDAVVIEYVDEGTWTLQQVQYPPNSETFTASNPDTKRLDGIVNRDQAFREAAFYYLQSIYRRENVQIGSEYEGRAITFGQTLRVSSELPQNYGQNGAITSVNSNTLTISPASSWSDTGPYFIRLRRPNGKWFGPVTVTRGDNDNEAVLDADDLATVEMQQGIELADVLARSSGGEDPSFELGTADNQSKVVKVLTGQPNGSQFTLTLVVDDERVHATDIGTPPILPVGQFPANSNAPLLAGLSANWVNDVLEPKLGAVWFPSPGAYYYVADVSYDDGATWIQVYEGQDNKFTQVVARSALTLRVQAVGVLAGPYATVSLEAPIVNLADNTVSLKSLQDAITEQIEAMVATANADRSRVDELANAVQQFGARTNIDKRILKTDLVSTTGPIKASITQVQTVATDTQTAVVDLTTTVTALDSSVTTNASAISTLNGYAAAQWSVMVDVGGNVVGVVLFNDSTNISNFTATVDTFRVSFPGQAGGDAVPVFTISNVDGVAKVALRGDMYVDGGVITRMLAAGAVTAVTVQAGAINTTQLAVNSVGIDQLIQNAATKVDYSTHAATGFVAGSTTLITRSIEVKSGSVIISYCSEWNIPFNHNESVSTNPWIDYIDFFVDGALLRTFSYRTPTSVSVSGGSWRTAEIANPINLMWLATGLTVGTHTFTIRARDGIAGYDVNLNSGALYLTDFRR